MQLSELPGEIMRGLPRYPTLPCVRIGRLAIDLAFRGRGLGPVLLVNAAARAARSDVAAFALIVDAKDDVAAAFYERHLFLRYGGGGLRLIAPLDSFKALTR